MNDQFDYTQPIDFEADGFGTPQNQKKPNKKATAALVLGILSLLLGCCGCCCISPILAVIAIVLAFVSKAQNDGVMAGKAKAGLILSIIALVILLICIIAFGVFANNPDMMVEMFGEYFDPIFQEEYGMTFEEYIDFVETADELDTFPNGEPVF